MAEWTLEQLAALSRELGGPAHRCSIVGEGNTSARIDADSFYVKATGFPLGEATPESFVRVSKARANAMLDQQHLSYEHLRLGLEDAKADLEEPHHPSRETLLHAACMGLDEVQFVARTSPTAISALVCSRDFFELAKIRLTPDQVAVCGAESLALPFAAPGIKLAHALRSALAEFVAANGTHPRVVLLQNNGMLALGASAEDALAVTSMAIEIATVLATTRTLGGPRALEPEEIEQVKLRADRLGQPATRRVDRQREQRSR